MIYITLHFTYCQEVSLMQVKLEIHCKGTLILEEYHVQTKMVAYSKRVSVSSRLVKSCRKLFVYRYADGSALQ